MKFIVSSATLLKSLQGISGVLNTNNTLPILDNFLFSIKGNTLTVSASDLETIMTAKLQLDMVEKDVLVALPAKTLLDALKTFADQPLNFTVSDDFMIEIATENGKFKLAGQNGIEFPKHPSLENPKTINMDSAVLFNAISKTLFAAGNDDLRPVMSGVFFQFGSDEAIFASTDAHKLVKYSRKDVKASESASFIMPKKPLNLLKNITTVVEGDIQVSYTDTNALFTTENITLVCRLIDGKYPNYEAVIPKDNPNTLLIDRQLFLNTIRRVSIFSNKTTHQVRLKIAGSELQISAEDIDFSNEGSERLTCSYEGDDIEIGFNSRFLMEMLSNLSSPQVKLELSAPNRAGILFPQEEDADINEELLMLVMPVMINN